MLRMIAIAFGVIMIFVGIIGFLPTFVQDGLLFGYFEVNALHNMIHIVTGVLAIMASTSLYYTRLFFQVFGVVYLLVAILGFVLRGDLFVMHVNTADNFLHVAIAAFSLYLGFLFKRA